MSHTQKNRPQKIRDIFKNHKTSINTEALRHSPTILSPNLQNNKNEEGRKKCINILIYGQNENGNEFSEKKIITGAIFSEAGKHLVKKNNF